MLSLSTKVHETIYIGPYENPLCRVIAKFVRNDKLSIDVIPSAGVFITPPIAIINGSWWDVSPYGKIYMVDRAYDRLRLAFDFPVEIVVDRERIAKEKFDERVSKL